MVSNFTALVGRRLSSERWRAAHQHSTKRDKRIIPAGFNSFFGIGNRLKSAEIIGAVSDGIGGTHARAGGSSLLERGRRMLTPAERIRKARKLLAADPDADVVRLYGLTAAELQQARQV